jgi:hypothetical protein
MATPTKRPTQRTNGNGNRDGNGKEQTCCAKAAAAAEQAKQPARKVTTPVHVPPGHGKATAKAPEGAKPTNQQIAERAYLIWELQGRQHGRELENWLEAERQLRQEMGVR